MNKTLYHSIDIIDYVTGIGNGAGLPVQSSKLVHGARKPAGKTRCGARVSTRADTKASQQRRKWLRVKTTMWRVSSFIELKINESTPVLLPARCSVTILNGNAGDENQ